MTDLFNIPAILLKIDIDDLYARLVVLKSGEAKILTFDKLGSSDNRYDRLMITILKASDRLCRVEATYGNKESPVTKIAGICYIKRFTMFRESFILAMLNINED